MSDIYEKWLRNKDLHITEKHELNQEEYTKDLSCNICYPIRYIGIEEEREFLKFWKIYLELVPQISKEGYNLLTIVSFTKLINTQQEEFIEAATKLIWSAEYNKKLKYRIRGLIEILWIIVRICIEETDEGLFLQPDLNRVKEEVENNCELLLHGYTISDNEVHTKFEKFWKWIRQETTAFRIYNEMETLEIFKELLYLEDRVNFEGNRDKFRELQKAITYNRNDYNYPKAWINEDLTDEIIKVFIESNNFEEETIEPPTVEDIFENDTYQEIFDSLKEKELEVTIEDILRIIKILKFTPEEIYEREFIRVYNSCQHLKDGEISDILIEWLRNRQTEEIYEEILSESGDEIVEENVINTPPILQNPNSENSTRSNSPILLNMATEDHIKTHIRQAINLAFGIDLGQNIDQPPAQTITNTIGNAVANLIPPINRAAKIGDLPLFCGGDQDPFEWIRDFEVVWNANGYLPGANQIDKIRKAAVCMRGDAADWYNEVHATITRWDAHGGNGDFIVEFKKRYASRTKQNQWAMELQNIKQQPGEKVGAYANRFKKLVAKVAPQANDMADRFKVNYFIKGLDPLIAGRTYENNPGTLEEAITRARAIETGNNFLFQSLGQQTQTPNINNGNTSNNKPVMTKPKDEVDELAEQLEKLKIAKMEKEIRALKGELYGNSNRNSSNIRPQFDLKRVKCYSCGKLGYTSRYCRERNNRRN